MSFIRAYNPIWYLPDLTGLALNDQYYAFFLTNVFPYVPQAVYSDVAGTIPWPHPLQFQPGGTLPNNLYFNSEQTYRIEIRHGNSQSDALIYEVNNFDPGVTGSIVTSQLDTVANQITNPQFSIVNFFSATATPYIYAESVSSTYEVEFAPGWILRLVGAGSVQFTQLELAGNIAVPSVPPYGNAPYAIRMLISSWSTATLVQRFKDNGAIFAGGSVSMAATIRPATAQNFTLNYVDNQGLTVSVAGPTSLIGGVFTELRGGHDLNASGNTATGSNAYVEMQIILPVNETIDITNVQFIGHNENLPDGFVEPYFQQETTESEKNKLFHYYADQLRTRGKDSLLTGWDFPLNPWQLNGQAAGEGDPAGFTTASIASYICDQTILYQETASTLTISRGTGANLGQLSITAINGLANNKFALVQFIDPATFNGNWGQFLSAFVRAGVSTAQLTSVKIKARLIYRSTLPPTIGAAQPLTGWDGSGDVILGAGWTAITPLNDPAYILTTTTSTEDGTVVLPGYSFDSFSVPEAPTSDYLSNVAIVLYTQNDLTPAVAPGVIYFQNVSLVPNVFAVEANKLSFDETLKRCQYYYERGYAPFESSTGVSTDPYYIQSYAEGFGFTAILLRSLRLHFKNIKRAIPTMTIKSSNSAAADRFYLQIYDNLGASLGNSDFTFSTSYLAVEPINLSTAFYSVKSINSTVSIGSFIPAYARAAIGYIADARLGL